jgi:LuxR family transcriptional regulator, regulator of acetate metabolism
MEPFPPSPLDAPIDGAPIPTLQRHLDGLRRVREAVAKLWSLNSRETVARCAVAELCGGCGFARAMLAHLAADAVVVSHVYVPGRPQAQEADPTVQVGVESGALAAERLMIRSRGAVLVRAASDGSPHQRVFGPDGGGRAYVAAPIVQELEVTGFLYADLAGHDRAPDEIDRDHLDAFAEGFSRAIERATLVARLRREAAAESPTTPLDVEALLTTRELDVLELMLTGATNDLIAERLLISPGTAKAHVANILHKLQAANRIEAISRVLRESTWRDRPTHATLPPASG